MALELNPTYTKALYKQCQVLLDMNDWYSSLKQTQSNLKSLSNPSDIQAFKSLESKIQSKLTSNKLEETKNNDFNSLLEILEKDAFEVNFSEEQMQKLLSFSASYVKFYEILVKKISEILRSLTDGVYKNWIHIKSENTSIWYPK